MARTNSSSRAREIASLAAGEDLGDISDRADEVQVPWDPELLQPEELVIRVRMEVEPSVDGLLERVQRFNSEIIGLPIPDRAQVLGEGRRRFRVGHLNEEIAEFEEATGAGDAPKAADALLDLVYVALGALYEMGVPYGPAFDQVHDANMQKVRGELSKRPDSAGYDAVKPEGWKPPDQCWIDEASPETVELGVMAQERGLDLATLQGLSPVFIHVARIRAGKGRDYNTSVGLHDYFKPHGHRSYHQMMHLKTLRAQSIVELMERGKVPNYEGLLDTLYDSLNYTCFWAEAIREDLLPITGTRGAADNGAVETA